jgi:predicted DNA-binding transcriptional regulator YafY
MVMLLLGTQRTLEELAEELHVSTRTIRRDVADLAGAGFVITCESELVSLSALPKPSLFPPSPAQVGQAGALDADAP